jgi:3-methyladenine DNA glycosylase AlkD
MARTPQPSETATSIRRELASLSSLTTPSVRAVRRRWSKALANEPADVVLAVVRSLVVSAGWPERVVAFELLAGHAPAMARLNGKMVDDLATGLADWGSIDLFGVTIAGVAWRLGQVSDSQVMRWTRSSDRWRRRLALVATVALNIRSRGGTGDVERTLAVCRGLVDDRDDMVVKALSWALRELAKRDPEPVAAFLRDEEARLAPRVRREVRTKLETGLKTRPARRS